jgi:ubiquinol-cytochrome c reductase cytochrome c subunit
VRARRKRLRRLTHALVLLVGLVALGSLYAALSSHTAKAEAAGSVTDLRAGRELFVTSCASCHGLNASGGNRAPSLIGVGAAAVDFQVSTGRMPLQQHGPEGNRKPVAFDRQQINQLAAYVGSLAPGPGIPQGVDQYKSADVAQGGELFRTNCSQCHNVVGSGGALTYGRYAPPLGRSTPTQIYEAMITGPENMPVFSDTTLSPQEKFEIIHYIRTIKTQADPGGNGLGHVGPVTEAIVVWVAGIGLCVAATLWIGSKL